MSADLQQYCRCNVSSFSPGPLTRTVHTLPAGYTTHHTNLNLTEFTSGVLHSAVLKGLEPSSTYFYRVGDADLGLSTIRNFTTPGVLGAEEPIVLGILGDLGQTNDSRCGCYCSIAHRTHNTNPCGTKSGVSWGSLWRAVALERFCSRRLSCVCLLSDRCPAQ